MNSFSEQYRPTKPNQLIGDSQKKIAKALLSDLSKREILLSGPSGTGKTTLALMYARSVLGLSDHQDVSRYVTIVNGSADNGVDFIRERIIGVLPYKPLGGSKKIFLIDEAHGLSKQAQNALLVETEPVPSHCVIIFCTTESDKLLKPLKSRFSPEYRIEIPSEQEMIKKIKWVCGSKKVDIPDSKIVQSILTEAQGNIRTLDRILGDYVEGTYNPTTIDEEDEQSAAFALMFKKPTLQQAFNLIDKQKDYYAFRLAACAMAINQIKKGKNIAHAKKVLLYMGPSLVVGQENEVRIEILRRVTAIVD